MQRLLIMMSGMFLFTAMVSNGQELVYEFVPDTTYYESTNFPNTYPEPEDLLYRTAVNFYFAQKRKNSETYDIFARTGKIGNVNISNAIWNQYTGGQYPCLTQKFFDNDDGWEVLFSSANAGVLLLDDDGSTLYISGANNDSTRYSAYIGFDGSSTYLIVENKSGLFYPYPYKLYRFRTNISSPSFPHSLSKKSAGPNPMMVFGPSNDYQITLQPTGGGKTSVQLFDMLGRLVFEKRIDDLTKPVSFSIPAAQTSRTPFITKVQDQNGTTLKKEIPVR